MSLDQFYVFASIIYLSSIVMVLGIARRKALPFSKWVFYAFFFHLFALVYLVVRGLLGRRSS